MKDIRIKDLFEFVFRIYVFVFLNVYGIGKIIGGQFYTPKRIPEEVASATLGSANDFDLAWTFMGRSFGYILFIGLAEIIGAWMLLFNRTKLIGTVILIPIMLNIIVFDVFFLDTYGALASASIYTCMLFFILLLNKEKVMLAYKALTDFPVKESKPFKYRVYKIAIALIVFGLIFLIDQLLVNFFGHGKG